MIVEYAQLLSTAHHVLDGDKSPLLPILYKKTHENHPSAVWVRKSRANYEWTVRLLLALHLEWQERYHHSKDHLTIKKLFPKTGPSILDAPKNIPEGRRTTFAVVVPDNMKKENAVLSYRSYYKNGKNHLLDFGNRGKPDWL